MRPAQTHRIQAGHFSMLIDPDVPAKVLLTMAVLPYNGVLSELLHPAAHDSSALKASDSHASDRHEFVTVISPKTRSSFSD
jgi:hypothetical protein